MGDDSSCLDSSGFLNKKYHRCVPRLRHSLSEPRWNENENNYYSISLKTIIKATIITRIPAIPPRGRGAQSLCRSLPQKITHCNSLHTWEPMGSGPSPFAGVEPLFAALAAAAPSAAAAPAGNVCRGDVSIISNSRYVRERGASAILNRGCELRVLLLRKQWAVTSPRSGSIKPHITLYTFYPRRWCHPQLVH